MRSLLLVLIDSPAFSSFTQALSFEGNNESNAKDQDEKRAVFAEQKSVVEFFNWTMKSQK